MKRQRFPWLLLALRLYCYSVRRLALTGCRSGAMDVMEKSTPFSVAIISGAQRVFTHLGAGGVHGELLPEFLC